MDLKMTIKAPINARVMAIPDTITMYFIQIIPDQSR